MLRYCFFFFPKMEYYSLFIYFFLYLRDMCQIHVGYNGSPKLQPSYALFFRWLYTITTTITTTSFWVLHFWSSTSTHYTHTLLLIHYQHSCCCMGVFNTTYSSHHSPKRTEMKGEGRGDWLPIGCDVQQNKTKNSKQFEKIYNWSKQMVDCKIKKELSQKSKRAFLTTTVIRQLWVPLLGGLQPTFASIECMYLCMYMYVCVCFLQVFLEGLS